VRKRSFKNLSQSITLYVQIKHVALIKLTYFIISSLNCDSNIDQSNATFATFKAIATRCPLIWTFCCTEDDRFVHAMFVVVLIRVQLSFGSLFCLIYESQNERLTQ